jgi:thioredoxin 2
METPTSIVTCDHCGTKNRVPAAATGTPRCGACRRPVAWIADAGDGDFSEVVEQSPLPVLVDLWAPWCGPCRAVSPALEKLARSHAGRVKLVKVNVDTSPTLSQRFMVQGIPTLLLLRGGDVVARQTGAAPEPTLRAWLDDSLASVAPGV